MAKKLLKRNCVALMWKGNQPYDKRIVGIFKNRKEALEYVDKIDKNKERYYIVHTKRFIYVNAYEGEKRWK